ncbi:VWA domain-containing protein, partial [Xanthomonas sp. Kuri4-1]
MGYGNYSHAAHAALISDRAARPGTEVFAQRGTHPLMDPKGLRVRESRDSADHPDSLPVVFALDVTGSMGDIPRLLAQQELPTFMQLITDVGVADPQLLFMAIGDAHSDQAPLQVGQFESTAELMDQWLTRSYLEGAGGGTGEESYELAFYVLAQHTETDAWTQRRKKGYLFMTGDELPYPAVSRHQIGQLIGEPLDEDIPIEEVIAAAAERWHLFFLIPDPHRRARCEARWRELLGDQVLCMESPEDACAVAAAAVALTERAVPDLQTLAGAMEAKGL